MTKQIKQKIAQIFYRSPKQVDGKRVSTSLTSFEKEIGNAMNTFFRENKKKSGSKKTEESEDTE